ncbi:hypothetical protein O181_056319 [Austropuccinia psidii MF-1]|uniref:Uncharacterized protein n=1 Tax=Austropuccinia psidii MF-1 TaxID=1389203 RepID=A0A9Q3E8C3_9BASI|nr:hypothetical protein [Austropuccinia psidii MF-1]
MSHTLTYHSFKNLQLWHHHFGRGIGPYTPAPARPHAHTPTQEDTHSHSYAPAPACAHANATAPHPWYLEENYIPLETQSQANIPVTHSEPEGSKGKGKRHSEGLITARKWTRIATERNRKPINSASIQGKPTSTTCTGKITVINPALTSKGKLPTVADNRFVQGTVKETLVCKCTSQRTEKACPEPEDLEEDTLETVVDGKTFREIISTLSFTFKFNRNLKPEEWKDMDQVLQLHQLLKDLFQWSMDNKRFNLESHWAELGGSYQNISFKVIDFKHIMVITRGCNPTRKFRLMEVRANRIRENQAIIQAIEEKLTQTGNT